MSDTYSHAVAALEAWAEQLPYRFHVGDKVRWSAHPTYPYIVVTRSWVVRPIPGTLKYSFAARRLLYTLRFDSPDGGLTIAIDEDALVLASYPHNDHGRL
jgi:hypothetical protein